VVCEPHQVFQVNAERPEPGAIACAAAALQAGLLVAFPTDTVYGLGCDSRNPEAVDRLYAAKRRPRSLPLVLLLAEPGDALRYAAAFPPAAQKAAAAFWPGPLTLVVPGEPGVTRVVAAGYDTVGLRVPDHAVARALIRAAGFAPATTSANRSGGPDPLTADEVVRALDVEIGVLLDAGPVPVGTASTVLDVSGAIPVVLREGAVSVEDLERALGEVARGG